MKHGQCAILVVQNLGMWLMWHLESLDRFVSWFKDVWYLHIYIYLNLYIYIHIYIYMYIFFNICVEQIELEGETVFFLHKKFQHHGWSWYSKKYLHI